jgi:hypothetical protein
LKLLNVEQSKHIAADAAKSQAEFMEKMMHAHLVQLHRILKLSDGCLRAAQDQPCA